MQKSRNTKSLAPRANRTPQQVRIIGGQWKRTPLPVLDAEGLRPTPDRVRETAFNWLNHLLDGDWEGANCLDLFAGTGALGFEAASRGAAHILMVENSSAAVRQLEANKAKLCAEQIAIQRGDALSVAARLAANNQRFRLIFLDPPYHHDWLVKILPLCKQLLMEDGLVYAEAETAIDSEASPEWLADWEVVRADKAGMVFYHLLQCKTKTEFQA
jgi:16S rRNA (guanine966-N2)-methyltransferase